MKKLILFGLLIFNSSFLVAQTAVIDSLRKSLSKHTKEDTSRVNLLNNLAFRLYPIDYDKTYTYAKEAVELSNNLGFIKGKARALHLIGIYYHCQSKFPEAIDFYQKSLKIKNEIGDRKGKASSLNNIGIIYESQGNYPQARRIAA